MKERETERTLAIIKPDGVRRGLTGEIINRIESNGLRVVGLKMTRLQIKEAEQFYAVHRERPFFSSLTRYMASGLIVPMVLSGTDAVKQLRNLMGATNPKEAAPGTIRAEFGSSIEENTIHGSDAPQSAATEITFFFNRLEIME